MNRQIIKLAVTKHYEAVRSEIPARGTPTDEFDVALTGVPGLHHVTMRALLRDDDSIRTVITHINNNELDAHDWLTVELDPPKPATAPAPPPLPKAHDFGPQWRQLENSDLAPEVQFVDATGTDVTAMVDTKRRNWELTCECGRKRYTTRNNVPNISLCRVCAGVRRKRLKYKWQQMKRESTSSTPTTTQKEPDAPAPSKQDSQKQDMIVVSSTSSAET